MRAFSLSIFSFCPLLSPPYSLFHTPYQNNVKEKKRCTTKNNHLLQHQKKKKCLFTNKKYKKTKTRFKQKQQNKM